MARTALVIALTCLFVAVIEVSQPATPVAADSGEHLAGLRFPLHLNQSHHHLVDRWGRPFLVKVMSAWGLIQALPEDEALAFMDSVKARGFNTLLVSAISWDRRFAGGPPRWNGVSPFTVEWDFSKPSPEYFAHVDRILAAAYARGLLVLLVPSYLGYYSDPTQGWASRLLDPHNSPEKTLQYGQFLGKRYAHFPNIVWVAGGDNNASDDLYPHMRNLIDGIKQYSFQLWTGHFDTTGQWATNNLLYADEMDIDSLYMWTEDSFPTKEPQYLSELARVDSGRMLLQLDQSYEHDFPHNPDNEDPQWIRRKNYDGLLSGVAGTSFCPGARGNQEYTFQHWRPLMDTEGMQQARHTFALFESRAWQDLVPDQEQPVVIAGRGEYGSVDYVCAAITKSADTMIAYVPTQRTLAVDLSRLSGDWARAWWFDPRTGKAHYAGLHRTRGSHTFQSPEGDWVLVLDDVRLRVGPPGTPPPRQPPPVPPPPEAPAVIGETSVFDIDDSGNDNLLVAQAATIDGPATLTELSFYVAAPAGKLRLGIYDASGAQQLPGRLLGTTQEFAAVSGWNSAALVKPVALQPGTYWLSYLASDAELHFRRVGQDLGDACYAHYDFASLPEGFPSQVETIRDQWSFYGTLR